MAAPQVFPAEPGDDTAVRILNQLNPDTGSASCSPKVVGERGIGRDDGLFLSLGFAQLGTTNSSRLDRRSLSLRIFMRT
jgi:hypothetical protein